MLDAHALATLFTEARTWNAFRPDPLDPALLAKVYDLAKMAPTSANGNPMRIAFVRSPEAKERLLAAMAPGNVDKTRSAPVTAIFAYDLAYFEKLPVLLPPLAPLAEKLRADPAMAEQLAKQSGTLQAGYFMLAARALGLDCGPMGGFDAKKVDETFFAGTSWRANFLCNLGHGDPKGLHPRQPRLTFEEACTIL